MKKPFDRLGFTIFEILVAMILLSAISAAALSSFSSSAKIVQSSNNTATNIARGYLERFYEYVREDWRATAGLPVSLSAPGPQGLTQTLDGVTYTTNYAVNDGSSVPIDVAGDGLEDYRKVKMTVSW